ncbi:single-stranded DNA-binding protein [Aeromonas phage B614]|nr:single-stranded DNA-binding protein [Aeromonas phage B614]UYD58316.1 single-stranded DNA-binding protein [Aeromonas phage UP87]UYD58430.1 single-stranded DNA-binding protein [Aeromonas phage avDM14-QBC]UYD58646.1 single-stranded DNA-binding protein [Aeromonas phage avDM10-HWA]UYD59051.1 single-stranded DNA-binding protein [Aeromonas phage avDM7-IJDJ]UYD59863.1 single-stranded DNA-binding protein [Aeromonas phage avDM9-HANS]
MFKRSNPSQLQAQLQALKGNQGGFGGDKNEWRLKADASGNGQAVIRFLPGKGAEGLPFVKLINHGFKKNNKWYIENCSSTHGDFDNCPVCQHLSRNDSYNTNKEEYGLLKRKTSFWANILVIKDPATPENEGKVMKMRFGVKIMEKIESMINVDADLGETPIDVTCPFEGCNFVYKVKKVGGFTNYDDCKFLGQSEIAKINESDYQKFLDDGMDDLSKLVAPTEFKSLEDLEKKFKQIMGTSLAAGKAASAASALNNELNDFDSELTSFETDVTTPSAAASLEGSADVDDDLDALLG